MIKYTPHFSSLTPVLPETFPCCVLHGEPFQEMALTWDNLGSVAYMVGATIPVQLSDNSNFPSNRVRVMGGGDLLYPKIAQNYLKSFISNSQLDWAINFQ